MPKKTTLKVVVAPPSKLYRRIAFSFIAVAVILLAVVSYFSFSKVTILIKPKREVLKAPLSVDISPVPDEYGIRGTVIETVAEAAKTFPLSSEGGTTVESQATGGVLIMNKTANNQPLVRTTRLLSPEGMLFRLSDTVLVPAQGSIEAGVYADVPGKAGEIESTSFTIPGLWEGLQDKIYAESSKPMCCGTKTARVVTDDDLKSASQTLETEIFDKVRTAFREDPALVGLDGGVMMSEILERTSDSSPGTEADNITVGLKLKVTGVFYDQAALQNQARQVLSGLVSPEEVLIEVPSERMSVTVERQDVSTRTARLAVDSVGLLALRPESVIFEKSRLIGLDEAALESYFGAWSSVESVQVKFWPSWLRRVPRLKDHVEIKIQN